jgi:hypothetical protein
MAENSVPMQIWLGKQYLGQKDKQEQTGPDGGPVKEYIITGVPRESHHCREIDARRDRRDLGRRVAS